MSLQNATEDNNSRFVQVSALPYGVGPPEAAVVPFIKKILEMLRNEPEFVFWTRGR